VQLEKTPRKPLPRSKIVDRDPYFLDACRGKKVLHIGCTDAPFTRAKFASGALLHQKLGPITSILVGVDIDKESVDWLTERGVKDLYVGDASNIKTLVVKIGFIPDVIVAGEVLEHLSSPLDFLTGVREGMKDGTKLLISVPNAFWLEGFLHVLLGKEKVHPEHVAYYSYYTIRQLLERADLEVQDCHPCRYQPSGWRKALTDAIQASFTWVSPHFAPGYVVLAARPAMPERLIIGDRRPHDCE
jgi:2-polyprenyl-3-methyl-5-hydroxy-6-metoxy-1,4-benzoquinol methylase